MGRNLIRVRIAHGGAIFRGSVGIGLRLADAMNSVSGQ